jgi:succinoglycan biosynthesis protein ExoO
MVEMNGSSQGVAHAPRVSVVIACFNCERYIEKAIDSVLAQTLSEIEAIVVDDGSSDRSFEIVERYDDPRVRLLRTPHNAGPSAARNLGFDAARGDWIAVLDGDDWMEPDRLGAMIDFAEGKGADAVADDLYIIFDGELAPRSTWFRDYQVDVNSAKPLEAVDLVSKEIGVIKAVFRRSLVVERGHRYDEGVKYGEDFLLYLSWLLDGRQVYLLDRPMYFLRRGNTGSLTTNHIALVERVLFLNEGLLVRPDILRRPDLLSALKRRVAGLRWLLRYHRFAYPMRTGRYRAGVAAVVRDPVVLIAVARHVWVGARQRLLATRS